ncbi:hypothetical protein [Burkholderia contaminans]|uniref:hypothetical protein n=1 Tax=Burkholderia contaminans TaxID=488447 RepID=UPI001581ACF1|nr:hypothetical protein [Burkholderia contaminans]
MNSFALKGDGIEGQLAAMRAARAARHVNDDTRLAAAPRYEATRQAIADRQKGRTE